MSAVAALERSAVEAGRSMRYPFAWVLAVLPFVVLVLLEARFGFHGLGDDWAQYLMHAQALADGRSYMDTGYIYTRFNHWLGPAAAPPGLPLLLAPIMAIAGPNILIMRVVMIAIAIAFVILAGWYFAKHESRPMGLGVALMCGLSPALVQNASWVLTDLPFAAVLWAVFLIADDERAWTWRKIVLITALGGFAVLLRPIGIAIVPALLAFTIVRYRDYRWAPAIPVALWLVGIVGLSLVADIQRSSVVALNPARILAWLEFTDWGWRNIAFYRLTLFYSHLYPFPSNTANDVFHLISISVMLVGLLSWIRRSKSSLLVCFACAYGLLLLIIPAHQHRYLWPLCPEVVFGLLAGIRLLAARFAMARFSLAPSAVSLVVAAVIAITHAVQVPSRADHRSELLAADVASLYETVREMARRESVRVTYAKPRSLAWQTGVHAMGPFTAPP